MKKIQKNIFNDLTYKIIDSVTPKSVSKTTIALFLLGVNIDGDPLSATYISKLLSEYSTLSEENMKKLMQAKDWSFSRLEVCINSSSVKKNIKYSINYEALKKEIIDLANKHHLDTKKDCEQLIKELIYLHFFGTPISEAAFCKYTKRVCTTYIPWDDKENHASQILANGHFLILTGKPGSGKTQLIKYLIQKYPEKYSNIYFSNEIFDTIENCITNMTFLSGKHTLKESLKLLKSHTQTSLVVFNVHSLAPQDLVFIRENLLNLNTHIIITSRVDTISSDIKDLVVNLDDRSIPNLQLIFDKICSNTLFTSEEFSTLCRIVDHNPLAINLIAKSLNANPQLHDKFLNAEQWIWYEKHMPSIHSSYKDETKLRICMQTILRRLIQNYPPDIFPPNVLSELAIWTKHPIPQEQLEEFILCTTIDNAILYGILQYEDDSSTNLFMPSLISDIIWNEYPISYSDYRDRIKEFRNQIKIGKSLSVPYTTLYPVILNMIFRFHFNVTHFEARKKPDAIFVEWNQLLVELIYYFTKLGHSESAQKIIPYLFYYEQNKINVDATNFESKCIRNLIEKQIQYMSQNDMTGSIADIINILQQTVSDYNKSTRKQRLSDYPYSLFFIRLIIQDIMNFQIRRLQNSMLYYLHGKSENSLQLMQNTLQDIITYLSNYNLLLPDIEFYSYYVAIHAYGVSLLFNRDYLSSAQVQINLLFERHALPEEQLLLARCQKLYFEFIVFMTDSDFDYNRWNTEIFNQMTKEYLSIASEIENKIYPWEVLWAFYMCGILLIYNISPYEIPSVLVLYQIKATLTNLSTLVKEQISFPANEKEKLLQLVSNIINE